MISRPRAILTPLFAGNPTNVPQPARPERLSSPRMRRLPHDHSRRTAAPCFMIGTAKFHIGDNGLTRGRKMLSFVLAGLALAGSPGPATLSLAATGAAFGARRGLGYMIGIIAGMVM